MGTLLLGLPCCEDDAYLGTMPITWLLPFLRLGELDALFFNRAVSRYLVSLFRLCASSHLRFTHHDMRKLMSYAQMQLDMFCIHATHVESVLRVLSKEQLELEHRLSFRIQQLGMTVACDILAPRLLRLPGWCVRFGADGKLLLVQDGEQNCEVEGAA